MYGDALTTKARVKDRLKIDHTNYDDLIDNLILSVTARIQQMTGRRFIEATYTNELHDGCDVYGGPRKMLILKNGPVQSVTSVQEKVGPNSNPTWFDVSVDYYETDLGSGALIFPRGMPRGIQNMRVTYVGGFSGYSVGIENSWVFNSVPTGTVNGSNRTFTLAGAADQVIVYVDGARELDANVTHSAGDTSFTLAVGREPYSSIVVDYKPTVQTASGDYFLPEDLVDVCERAVVYLFKSRETEGKTTESFGESSITWREEVFSKEMLATIRNYRRGYNL